MVLWFSNLNQLLDNLNNQLGIDMGKLFPSLKKSYASGEKFIYSTYQKLNLENSTIEN